MLVTASFIITKTWKQLRYLSVGEWISKVWYIQTMEYYPSLNRMSYQAKERHGGSLSPHC